MINLENYLKDQPICPDLILQKESYLLYEERFFVEKKNKDELLTLVQNYFEQKGFIVSETEDDEIFHVETSKVIIYSISIVQTNQRCFVRVLKSGISKNTA